MALQFHAGQREVQTEAQTVSAADMLGSRARDPEAPLADSVRQADLIILATADEGGRLRFQAVSGSAPLIEGKTPSALRLPAGIEVPPAGAQVGGIAIQLSERKRTRLNGRLSPRAGAVMLTTEETFANCRKYIAPSLPLDAGLHIGPTERVRVELSDEGLLGAVAVVETAFVASVSPSGQPDVSHRGGPTGFMQVDASAGTISWLELIGNGMFKTAGNIRATQTASLLVLDVASGDGYELAGKAQYETLLRYDPPRDRGLWPSDEDFPAQGRIVLRVEEAHRLVRLVGRRQRIEAAKVTSCSPVEDQVPR